MHSTVATLERLIPRLDAACRRYDETRHPGASARAIADCERLAGVKFPVILKTWLRLCDGGFLGNGTSLRGTWSSDEGRSIDEDLHQDWRLPGCVPCAALSVCVEFGIVLEPQGKNHAVLGHSPVGPNGGETFIVNTSFERFLDALIWNVEMDDGGWPFMSKSWALERDPDLEHVTQWKRCWELEYRFVKPEPRETPASGKRHRKK